MPHRACLAVVLAAGEGRRMRSDRPKVLHQVAGRSMLEHVLDQVLEAGADRLAVIVGPGMDEVGELAQAVRPGTEVYVQSERRGTAHAVLAAREALERGPDDLLVVFADTPLIRASTLRRLRERLAQGAAVAVLGFEPENPSGYGRLVEDETGLAAIREERDATACELALRRCNAGLMAIDGSLALDLLGAIGCANAQKEYYLTDVVAAARERGLSCALTIGEAEEAAGVNDRAQLAEAEAAIQRRLRARALENGATLVDPASVRLSWDTRLGRDVIVEPFVVFGPGVTVEDGATIHSFSHLVGARVGRGSSIGPFARLRPGTELAERTKVGNFVELKAARIGERAAISHLSYIGDADIGARVNVGAGTITCNYDGFAKHRTIVEEGAFIGSNSALVAPVRIGAGSYVGSGSVITRDVEADALAVARGRQVEKAGWARNFRSARANRKTD